MTEREELERLRKLKRLRELERREKLTASGEEKKPDHSSEKEKKAEEEDDSWGRAAGRTARAVVGGAFSPADLPVVVGKMAGVVDEKRRLPSEMIKDLFPESLKPRTRGEELWETAVEALSPVGLVGAASKAPKVIKAVGKILPKGSKARGATKILVSDGSLGDAGGALGASVVGKAVRDANEGESSAAEGIIAGLLGGWAGRRGVHGAKKAVSGIRGKTSAASVLGIRGDEPLAHGVKEGAARYKGRVGDIYGKRSELYSELEKKLRGDKASVSVEKPLARVESLEAVLSSPEARKSFRKDTVPGEFLDRMRKMSGGEGREVSYGDAELLKKLAHERKVGAELGSEARREAAFLGSELGEALDDTLASHGTKSQKAAVGKNRKFWAQYKDKGTGTSKAAEDLIAGEEGEGLRKVLSSAKGSGDSQALRVYLGGAAKGKREEALKALMSRMGADSSVLRNQTKSRLSPSSWLEVVAGRRDFAPGFDKRRLDQTLHTLKKSDPERYGVLMRALGSEKRQDVEKVLESLMTPYSPDRGTKGVRSAKAAWRGEREEEKGHRGVNVRRRGD